MKAKYIVELEAGVWIAPWDGDPGRTLIWENAKKYGTEELAKLALKVARTYRSFNKAKIIPV